MAHALEVGIGHCARRRTVLGLPLQRARRTAGLLPLIGKQVSQIHHRPLGRCRGPRTFKAGGHGVFGITFTAGVLPAKALLNDRLTGRLGTDTITGLVRTMGLTKRVTARNQRDCFFVIHRHTTKGLADIMGREHRIGVAVGAFGVHINQTHLYRCEPITKLTTLGITLIGQHLCLGTPVDPLGLPIVRATTCKTEGFEAHVFHRHIAGEDHEVCPGDLVAILLLDRPQQAAGLVEVAVVRPAVQWLEALLTAIGATATIRSAVGAGAVPGHTDKERTIVAVISRPPRLRGGQRLVDIRLQCLKIQPRELGRVVKIGSQRVGAALVLTQGRQIQAGRPPGLCAFGRTAGHRVNHGQGHQGRRQCGVRNRRFQ